MRCSFYYMGFSSLKTSRCHCSCFVFFDHYKSASVFSCRSRVQLLLGGGIIQDTVLSRGSDMLVKPFVPGLSVCTGASQGYTYGYNADDTP